MKFFDASLCVGHGCLHAKRGIGMKQLPALMESCDVDKAIVWHAAQFDDHPSFGNKILLEEIAGNDKLLPVLAVLPPLDGARNFKTFFQDMKRTRTAALLAFPDQNRYQMRRAAWGTFMDEVSERKIPLILIAKLGITWPALYDFLKDYPKIRCLLQTLDVWGTSRQWWPLLDTYPNCVIQSFVPSLEMGGVEATVKRFGAERIVFGGGFPFRYLEGAALQLAHAEITDAEREMIAFKNLERILKEAEL